MATQMNPAAVAGLSGVARRLVVEGTLGDEDARRAVDASLKQKIPLGSYLIEHALANGAQVAMAASAEFGVPLFDVDALDINQNVVRLVNEKLITQHKALPLFKRGNRLYVGVTDPTNLHALDEIKFQTNLTVEPVLVSEEQLGRIIERALTEAGATIGDMGEDAEGLESLDLESGDLEETSTGIDATVAMTTPRWSSS